MTINQSDELTEFYKAYANWLDNGAIGPEFVRGAGLCSFEHQSAMSTEMYEEMTNQFRKAKLDHIFPFNQDAFHYTRECTYETCHLNPKRIAWVREHCNP